MLRSESSEGSKFETIVSPDGHHASINSRGAYVESFETINGIQLLSPFVKTMTKARGGVFACAPIFGPGDKVGLPQHGFARNLDWKVDQRKDPSSVEFCYQISSNERCPGARSYVGYLMVLGITVNSSGPDQANLQMGLLIENQSLKPRVVAPGFHPYFPIEAGKNAKDITFSMTESDGTSTSQQFTARQLSDSYVFTPQTLEWSGQFSSNGYEIRIDTEGLDRPVVWTDNPRSYVCFEPTAAGPVADLNLSHYKLESGESREYLMNISWKRHIERSSGALQRVAAMALQPPRDEALMLV